MGLFNKLFKKSIGLETIDSVQKFDYSEYETREDNSVRVELKDDFVDNYTFHQLWMFFENNNNVIERGTYTPSLGEHVQPITPKFMVYEYRNPPKFPEIRKLMKKYEENKTVELEEVYPQFSKPCMRIDNTESIHMKNKSIFQRMKSLFRCKSRQTSKHVFSSQFQLDEFTTLHSLQGDIESDTGVPDPIRKLRHRRAGCY